MSARDEFYRTILENLKDGVCGFDLDRQITYWNPGATAITGYAASEVIGKRCSDNVLAHVDNDGNSMCRFGCPLATVYESGAGHEAEVSVLHRSGHRVPVVVRTRALRNGDGKVFGGVQIFTDNAARVAAIERIEELERLSYIDPLTGLANRRYSEIILHTRCEELQRFGWSFGVILIDIDNLKAINDSKGHGLGDEVLKTVSRTLLLGSRPFDVKGRWGGDEFIAIIANVERDGLWLTASRLRGLIEESSLSVGPDRIRTTVSMGAALARPGENPLSIVDRADRVLYESKGSGRNRITVDPDC